jgi:hypothetical protein
VTIERSPAQSPTLAELVELARASGAVELRLRARGVVLTITTDAP